MEWKIIEGTDYRFVEKETSDFYSVQLLSGKWEGLVYTYGHVGIKEDQDNETATLKFNYKIEECPDGMVVFEDAEFNNYLGEVLANIIEESEFKIGENNGTKPADDRNQELNSERDLLP
jgi:hypothetical protein